MLKQYQLGSTTPINNVSLFFKLKSVPFIQKKSNLIASKQQGPCSKTNPPRLDRDEEADVGIASMQVFMAMVLISGVTVGVMLNTANIMKEEAEEVTREAIGRFSTGLEIYSVIGDRDATPINSDDQSASLKSTIQYLEITVRLIPGSNELNLNDVLLELTDNAHYIVLMFDPLGRGASNITGENNTLARSGERIKESADVANYTGYALHDPAEKFKARQVDGNLTGSIISYGSLVRLYVNLSANGMELKPSTEAELILTPVGSMTSYERFKTPESYNGRYIKLN